MRRDAGSENGVARGRRALLCICVVALALAVVSGLATSQARVRLLSEAHRQTAWAPCNRRHARQPSSFVPAPDAEAAALVTHQAEDRRTTNGRSFSIAGHRYQPANLYVPTDVEIRRFRQARTSTGQSVLQFNPYFRYVDGRDGLSSPSTDDLIQWVAHKWGIPEDWLRAEYVQESYWNQFQLGDESAVSTRWYRRYPVQARVLGSDRVFESMGVVQVKWRPDESVGPGSEPLRWESTAFAMDYQAAMVRLYYDDPSGARSAWGDRTYSRCEAWQSVGGWFEPYPWGNAGQRRYVDEVRTHLAAKAWTTAAFVHWQPSALPPGLTLHR